MIHDFIQYSVIIDIPPDIFPFWNLGNCLPFIIIQSTFHHIWSVSLSLNLYCVHVHHILACRLHLPPFPQMSSTFRLTNQVTKCHNGKPLLQITQVPSDSLDFRNLLYIPPLLPYEGLIWSNFSGERPPSFIWTYRLIVPTTYAWSLIPFTLSYFFFAISLICYWIHPWIQSLTSTFHLSDILSFSHYLLTHCHNLKSWLPVLKNKEVYVRIHTGILP